MARRATRMTRVYEVLEVAAVAIVVVACLSAVSWVGLHRLAARSHGSGPVSTQHVPPADGR